MFEKLDFMVGKYNEIAMKVADPAVIADQDEWRKLVKEMSDMEPIVNKYKEYKKTKDEIASTKELLADSSTEPELRELAKEELVPRKTCWSLQRRAAQTAPAQRSQRREKRHHGNCRQQAAKRPFAGIWRMYTRYAGAATGKQKSWI